MYKLWKRRLPPKMWTWLFAFIISDLPMFIMMFSHVRKNWAGIRLYSLPRLTAFLCVAIWTYIGPLLILQWFKCAETFIDDIDSIPGSNGIARKSFQKDTKRFDCCCLLWTLSPPLILLSRTGRHILESFYFYGFSDWNYWLFLICVLYVAFQTSTFYRFLFCSGNVVHAITGNKAIMQFLLSNEGRRLNLSSVGNLISRSIIYTSSGFLFFPILIIFFTEPNSSDFNTSLEASPLLQTLKLDSSLLVFVLMGIFLIAIITYLQHMNRLVNERAQLIKDEMVTALDTQKKRITAKRRRRFMRMSKVIFYRMEEQDLDVQIQQILKVNVNLIGTDQKMQLLFGILTTSFLPAVFSAILSIF